MFRKIQFGVDFKRTLPEFYYLLLELLLVSDWF